MVHDVVPPNCLSWGRCTGPLNPDWLPSSLAHTFSIYLVILLAFSVLFVASALTFSITLTPLSHPFLLLNNTRRPNSNINSFVTCGLRFLSSESFLFLDSDSAAQHNIQLSPVAPWFLGLSLQLSALSRKAPV